MWSNKSENAARLYAGHWLSMAAALFAVLLHAFVRYLMFKIVLASSRLTEGASCSSLFASRKIRRSS